VRLVLTCLVAAGISLPATSAAADGDRPVATITDQRVTESSGLVQSTTQPALAYTVNDSGNAPVIYVLDLGTGDVVGTARLLGVELVDAEALMIGADDRLYVGDIGDNAGRRRGIDLYAVEQPGRGDTDVRAERHPVRYADGPRDAEALVSDVLDGSFYIVTKGLIGGDVYRLDRLRAKGVTRARRLQDVTVPGFVTDADVLPERGGVVVRTYADIFVFALPGWEQLAARELPEQPQGETVAVIDGGPTVYVGTEGVPSPLLRVEVPDGAWRELGDRLQQRSEKQPAGDLDSAADPGGPSVRLLAVVAVTAGVLAVLGLGWLVVRGRRELP